MDNGCIRAELVPPSISTHAMATGLKVCHALYCGGQVKCLVCGEIVPPSLTVDEVIFHRKW